MYTMVLAFKLFFLLISNPRIYLNYISSISRPKLGGHRWLELYLIWLLLKLQILLLSGQGSASVVSARSEYIPGLSGVVIDGSAQVSIGIYNGGVSLKAAGLLLPERARIDFC